MKQSKIQIKSKLIIGLIALVTITLAIFGLADFSMPFESKVLDNAKLPRGSVSKTTVTIADDGAIICDSLVQGIRDCDLADGNYIFRVTGNVDGTEEIIDYPVELINYYNDVTYSLEEGETEKIISLGDDTTDYKMLAVKYHKDLTINEGITLTATNVEDLTYKKGMYICVLGELTNNGAISMTARGTYNCAGENVYLWKKTDGNYEYVPAVGGAGGGASYAAANQVTAGKKGTDGENRQTGGGGSGCAYSGDSNPYTYSGAGASGTSYSGGSGGGGANSNSRGTTIRAGNASPNGGPGGAGRGYRLESSWYTRRAGGGAGNLGANGGENALGNTTVGKGENGTGGLLIVYTDILYNAGEILSKGSMGGLNAESAGGSSGGGSINVFANTVMEMGEMYTISDANSNGGAGGTGSITVNEMYDKTFASVQEEMILNVQEEYQFTNKDFKYKYSSENFIEAEKPTGKLLYEILDSDCVSVDNTGKITAKKMGKATLKVTEVDTNEFTEIKITVGKRFTSLMQGIKELNAPDGDYVVYVNGLEYNIELINFYDDVEYNLNEEETEKTINLGDDSTEYKMLVVKYHKNLTVNPGVKITATNVDNLTYKKGMYICVMGELINRGTITMTARGTYNCEGENVYLWKNEDGSYEYVPAVGGAGGIGARNTVGKSNPGNPGENRATGGGGAGDSSGTNPLKGGNGAAGTSYSGGSGGGAAYHCAAAGSYAGGDAEPNGGAGGIASVRTNSSSNSVYASGGAGNLAGKAAYLKSSGNAKGNLANSYSENGTGGLLSIYAETLYNSGEISSKGSNVIGKRYNSVTRYSGGGASGGGSVNIFSVNRCNEGQITASGGESVVTSTGFDWAYKGANGGDGSVTFYDVEAPEMKFDVNQKYISINQKFQLNIIGNDKLKEEIGSNYSATDFVWKSSNEDIATVDSNGFVTGISEGYTTIYAYHENARIYAMAVINVAKEIAVPQVESGNGYTVVLRANGTVWAIGNNKNGQLGNGNNESKDVIQQIKINEYQSLSNIVKISVGANHVLALSKDGKVYAWGDNSYSQLGQNNNSSYNYAQLVLNSNATDYLKDIVDISAGEFGSVALDKTGNVYVWGNGTYGEFGKDTITSSSLPVKVYSNNIIQISMGSGNIGALASTGVVWGWGKNDLGQTGIEPCEYILQPVKIAANSVEVSMGATHSVVNKVNGLVYATGACEFGQLGTQALEDEPTFIKMILPEDVISGKRVKYVKVGRTNTTVLLNDGTVWITGYNGNGELSIGTTENSEVLVQGKLKENELKDVLMIGRNSGVFNEDENKYLSNNTLILENGDVYSTGNNQFAQIGNGAFNNAVYFTKMGFVRLEYPEKTIELGKSGYQIDISKIKYKQFSMNVYTEKANYNVGTLKFTSLNTNLVAVHNNGFVQAVSNSSGFADVKIDDITNGFYTTIRFLVNKLQNTEMVTYIYDMDDLIEFQTSVNSGVDYTGKKVHLMVDLDMSTVCSEALGTWIPIGSSELAFNGTFDGNYHSIKNLYMYSDQYQLLAFFAKTSATGIIQNLIFENPYVYNNAAKISSSAAAVVGTNAGKIINCGVVGGEITNYQTMSSSSYNAVVVSGIAGTCSAASIYNSYNTANLNGTVSTSSSSCNVRIGGVCGNAINSEIINCYNMGNVTGKGYYVYIGGVAGFTYKTTAMGSVKSPVTKNCYNFGNVAASGTTKYAAGVVGINGSASAYPSIALTNCYCRTNTTYSYYYYSSGMKSTTTGRTADETLKTYSTKLGNAFIDDTFNINQGYPVLTWQAPKVELNTKQTYIKVGEKFKVNISDISEYESVYNKSLSNIEFKWTSSNENIATVNQNGEVTGVSDGYTTVLAYNEEYNIKAICVINVAQNIANPQIETGDGFSIILRADGTVWGIGNNANGQLGDGTYETQTKAVQVKIDEFTNLNNIIKISVSANHVLALSKDGKVYSWGDNTYGALGTNAEGNSNYARLVLGEGGAANLNMITDISAGAFGSCAINSLGWIYVWGNNTYGEGGIDINNTILKPTKMVLDNAISASMGAGHIVALTQDTNAYTWGRNTYGELGIASTANSVLINKITENIEEISASGYISVLKSLDEKIYGAGLNTDGQLANGTTTNSTSFVEMVLPTAITEENKIQYIKAGSSSVSILLEDGTLYNSGNYANGLISNATSFEQAKNSNGNLENVLILGRSNCEATSLNVAVMLKDGDIYTIGDNTYGQIGDNTKTGSDYYKKMGYVTLVYDDKVIELDDKGYQIDTNKLHYKQNTLNAYNEGKVFELGEIKYELLDASLINITETGFITPKKDVSGILDVKIADVTNGFETYFSIISNRLKNTDTVTYIYNLSDLINFRDAVNAGDTYTGKSVYLMSDIDMSSYVSASTESWLPIGISTSRFNGLFDGNFHKISNLYVKSSEAYLGLFSLISQNSVIQNLIMENPYVYNSCTNHSYTGSIVGSNNGKILNCASIAGNVIASQTAVVDSYRDVSIGGIAGFNNINSAIINCYNTSSINAKTLTSTSKACETMSGGIVGKSSGGKVINCYNTGSVTGKARQTWTGGIVGQSYKNSSTGSLVQNCYNIGKISATGILNTVCGLCGVNGLVTNDYVTKMTNSYCTLETSYSYKKHKWEGYIGYTSGRVEKENLKSYAPNLGKAYLNDDFNINNGFPILWWQAPIIELNKKQEYIKIDEELQLNITLSGEDRIILGSNISNSDFIWSSSNEDVAIVNENGLVTGISEGSTTIYGYHELSGSYTICIINVSKEQTNPQVENGDGFTVILKADGTVWALGKNDSGQLGDGTNEERIEAVQVKIDEENYLTNIKKIAVGQNHALALTEDGTVYSWGANTYGQLGNNTKENSNYANLVLGEGGSENLERIVDISAGSYGSSAINKSGWTFIWGNGSYGEMGNNTTAMNLTPIKAMLNSAVSAACGDGHIAVLRQNANVFVTGRNTYGELGIGNTSNATVLTKAAENILEISAAGFETLIKTVDGTVLGSGLNTSGELATGTFTNVTSFTNMNLPEEVNENNKVKYIRAGKNSSAILLTDGTVYVTGNYTNGLVTKTNEFVQAEYNDEFSDEIIALGRNSGANTVVIAETGRIYTVGANTFAQIGNNTKDDTEKFTLMGYVEMKYPKEIIMHVSETKTISPEELKSFNKHFNVYKQDIKETDLIYDARIIDSNIAYYENGNLEAKKIGETQLVAKDEGNEVAVYIPIRILPENAKVMPKVEAANNFTVSLKADGTVWSFGLNDNGELGLGDNNYKSFPKQVDNLSEIIIKDISVGNNHVIVLSEDGKIYTWGLNKNGQLGIGTIKNTNIPQEIEVPSTGEFIEVVENRPIKVIASRNVSYIITQAGNVYAFGENNNSVPTLLETELDIIDISEDYMLDMNGDIYNLENQERITIVEKIKYITEGATHTVFLSENNTAYAIGSNTYGQFGDGTYVSNETEVVAIRNKDLTDILRNIEKIEAGYGYTVALLTTGEFVVFGSNQYEKLGIEWLEESNTVLVNENVGNLVKEENSNILLISAGFNNTAIALSDGNLYAWGLGIDGQLGNGEHYDEVYPQLVGKKIIESNTNNLVLNVNEVFELQANTTYFNLLNNNQGELSYESKNNSVATIDSKTGVITGVSQGITTIVIHENGTNSISVVQTRVLPEGIEIEPQVATNGSHTVTLKVDGTVWCYGNNTDGELGNNSRIASDKPVQAIFPEETTIVAVDAGENFSVALDSEGFVWTWGANDYYQLGNSIAGDVLVPTKVANLSNIVKISAGSYNVLAIDSNKEVYGWGLNSNGELGIGSYTNKIGKPTKAKYLMDIIDVQAGKNHSIALKATGEVYLTGLNLYGQLGNEDLSIKKINVFSKLNSINLISRITTTDSGNIVATINGYVYSWGLNIYGELSNGYKDGRCLPALVDGVEDIVFVSGGKNHSVLLDSEGKIYTSGSNRYGTLGNGTYDDSLNYIEVQNISDVMTISAGNTYNALAKEDGTVWGFGDYNHGDKVLKSKTNSCVPVQVENDEFSLGLAELSIKKSETVKLSEYLEFSFNLVNLDENDVGLMKYDSLNEEIAIANEYGEILGVREGFTWIKAIEEDGTEHVLRVYVIDNEDIYTPRISAGEDFAIALKSSGSVWSFGHNNNGELGIGSNRTKDIPEKTNVILTYNQISSGKSFTTAIRSDGTVWSFGKNDYGQLGINSTKNGLNPVQVQGLTDIIQIATGDEHGLALDSYGILYGWGRNKENQLNLSDEIVLIPQIISFTDGSIRNIYAGSNQTIIINTKGEIFGFGNILNGKLEGINNPVKVSITDNHMLILTGDNKVYEYNGNSINQLTTLEQIVDIDIKNGNNIAQTVDEKVYTWNSGEIPELDTLENIYTIASGENNSYVILTNGTVYAKGQNKYGQLGNSTRIDSLDKFTLVGDRSFTVEPESKILYVNDVEDLTEEIEGNEFNVFNKSIRNGEEYIWLSKSPEIVTVENGILNAIAEGEAELEITDTITGETVNIKRVVIPIEQDRIENININGYAADVCGELKYVVNVETNGDTGTINITTKDNTDRISIDDGNTWYENGKLTAEVDILNKEQDIVVLVETSNGTQLSYDLKINKIFTDTSLESISVNGNFAKPISVTEYAVVVPEETVSSNIVAIAKNSNSSISINGEEFALATSEVEVVNGNELKLIIPIIVQAENGDELEYKLIIYKDSEILKLENITVDGKQAIQTNEDTYSITIPRDVIEVEVVAKAISELVNVSLNNENSNIQISTTEVEITEELTEVDIKLSTIVSGEEVYRDYKLNIYKKPESGKIGFVLVNGVVINSNSNGEYEIYLPAETQKAEVEVIAENELDFVQIDSFEKQQKNLKVEVDVLNDVNEYVITISDEESNTSEEFKLYIKKPSVDTSVKEIIVGTENQDYTAKKSLDEDNVYIANVKSYDEYNVKVVTNSSTASVGIAGDAKVKNVATKVIRKSSNYMEIEFEVESENGEKQEYILKLNVMSANTELEYIKVNNAMAQLQADGSYLVNLVTPETQVTVNAKTDSESANVRIEASKYVLNEITEEVNIDSKETLVNIYVQAEDGTEGKYLLNITGLPDDTTLQKVVVNKVEATYIEGENTYEIRSNSQALNIQAIATDGLASVSFNNGEENIGSNTITLDNTKEDIIIKVKAQNGVDTEQYVLRVKEKSSDASISKITVNGKVVTKVDDGKYEINIAKNVSTANIVVEANDRYSVVYLDNGTQNKNTINVQKAIEARENICTVTVIAEDGTQETSTLTITRLENNVNIQELAVKLQVEEITIIEDETTGEVTEEKNIVEKTYNPEYIDGKYYLKIDRIDNANIKVVLEDSNAKVKIKNSTYTLGMQELEVDLPHEKNTMGISVLAEDGTSKTYNLELEKKSNDTSLKPIISEDIIKQDSEVIYVDENLETIELSFATNNALSLLKLANSEEYISNEINATISLADSEKVETGDGIGWPVNIDVLAEDGTIENKQITILKTGNANIDTVQVNNEIVIENDNTYTSRVTVADTANVQIKAEKETSKIEILKLTLDANDELVETVIATGTGTLNANVDTTLESQEYAIRITSAKESVVNNYNLVLNRKSTENGIRYVKVEDKSILEENKVFVTTVSKKEEYNVEIQAKNEYAKIKIAYDEYESEYRLGKIVEKVPVAEGSTLEINVTVESENGEQQEYKLYVTRISDNTELESLKVGGENVTEYNELTNTYSIIVHNTLEVVDLEATLVSDKAYIRIGDDIGLQEIKTNIELQGPGTTQKVTLEVVAEDGTTEYYYVDIIQLSASVSINEILVNNEKATRLNYTDYEITISNKTGLANVKVIAQDSLSTIAIDEKTSTSNSIETSYTLVNTEPINAKIIVTAEDGETSEEYNLTINIKDHNNNIEYVKVDSGLITPDEESGEYRAFVDNNAITNNIEIKAESPDAEIKILNKNNLNIVSEEFNSGLLNLNIQNLDVITKIQYAITSEVGETKTNTIVLTKVSDDNTLKELYVGNKLINVSEDGNYYCDIQNPSELILKAITTNQYANVRIDYFAEDRNITEVTMNFEELITKVPITITSQSGVTEKYYLYVRILEGNTLLDKVLVDSADAKYYQQSNAYVATVDNTKNAYEIFLMTVNDSAAIELYKDEEVIVTGIGSITYVDNFVENQDGSTFKVKVSVDDVSTEYDLNLVRPSGNTELITLEVNDVVRAPTEIGGFVYEVNIEKLATSAKIKVKTANSFATLKIGDHDVVLNEDTVTVNLNLEEDRTTVPVVVTAVDGTTIATYNILLLRQSNNADLESVVVNNQVIPNVENVYTYEMKQDEFTAHTEISMNLEDNATIQVDDKIGVGYLELDIVFDEETVRVEKIIKVTSEDGSNQKEYKLVLFKTTKLTGTVVTQNYEDKHISNISLHKVGEEEAVQTLTSNEAGTFEIEILEGAEYEIRIEKLGYLCKVITGIKAKPGVATDVGTHEIFAGDVVVTDEIEIDDLVAITDKFGTIIEVLEGEENEEAIFDLNEDGIVDKLDIDILKANYGKKVETIEWENPNEIENLELTDSVNVIYTGYKQNQTQIIKQDFILPISCDYKITSQYGTRIHPVTGEEKKHTGIDISGTHHTEIYSIADGEVTFAGVQNGFGNCIEIKHVVNGETIYSFYAHLSRIDVEAGQTVTQGQTIGLEGGDPTLDPNPGSSTGHHLHFEIRKATGYGNDINPMDYIKF